MSIAYNGVGKVVATFECFSNVEVGDLVVISQSKKVARALKGNQFAGVCVSKNGNYVGVQIKGAITMPYNSVIPVGYVGIVAEDNNKIKHNTDANALKFLVVETDIENKFATFII